MSDTRTSHLQTLGPSGETINAISTNDPKIIEKALNTDSGLQYGQFAKWVSQLIDEHIAGYDATVGTPIEYHVLFFNIPRRVPKSWQSYFYLYAKGKYNLFCSINTKQKDENGKRLISAIFSTKKREVVGQIVEDIADKPVKEKPLTAKDKVSKYLDGNPGKQFTVKDVFMWLDEFDLLGSAEDRLKDSTIKEALKGFIPDRVRKMSSPGLYLSIEGDEIDI